MRVSPRTFRAWGRSVRFGGHTADQPGRHDGVQRALAGPREQSAPVNRRDHSNVRRDADKVCLLVMTGIRVSVLVVGDGVPGDLESAPRRVPGTKELRRWWKNRRCPCRAGQIGPSGREEGTG